jgi:hypothetical protein
MGLNEKILNLLNDRVVLKPLTRWNEAYKEFPRYVMVKIFGVTSSYVMKMNFIIHRKEIGGQT